MRVSASSLHIEITSDLYIDGTWQVGAGESFSVVNPYDNAEICRIASASAGQVMAAADAAHRAFNLPSWRTMLGREFAVGVCVVAAQVLVPFASHLTTAASRGRVTGRIMGGLLTGIMLARPVSSLIAGRCGWRAVFAVSGVLLLVLVGILLQQLPERRPAHVTGYRAALASMWQLVLHTPLLRRRALYQGIMFAAFNMFWTGSPLLLTRHYGMTFNGVALL
jgi:predicted MFS family arabinose efflux permease